MRLAAALAVILGLPSLAAAADPVTLASGQNAGSVVITHGGVGSPPEWSADCSDAALAGASAPGTALDAVCAAVVHLEDLCRFNAGTGANVRLDGKTIQMDAAVMTSDGQFAAVAAIERVLNPVLVAREVLATPHRLLVGDGATRFAHVRGFADQVPICDEAVAKFRERWAKLLRGEAGGGFDDFDWRAAWNYPTALPAEAAATGAADESAGDTVGAVAGAVDGTFAAALSTGGTSITLYGRVGDVPIYGCGCFAGPAGAVACTGHGEEIIRLAMARLVYERMASGDTAREAVRAGCEIFGQEWPLGLIAVGPVDWAVGANAPMAWGQAAP
ncbi:MAG TPA: isoaspartyl peptidase/L-asparaginase [Candidatus Krumholzibacteria bacterium]|nr:isoaspartyl peptidase/L-asparaginase [Candidatus Krumholzibacteria bacterium]HPD70846.1 isoaspartyl peptidase/L-asparaginase [Candidatus Krumholzibacteria bacterium]HRY39454.1 isoaspartyl peptidase/L-asparaginase [Candidatus Krumholzibacteria bacterium]